MKPAAHVVQITAARALGSDMQLLLVELGHDPAAKEGLPDGVVQQAG